MVRKCLFIPRVYGCFFSSALWLQCRTVGTGSGSAFPHLCLVLPFIFKANSSQTLSRRLTTTSQKTAHIQENICASQICAVFFFFFLSNTKATKTGCDPWESFLKWAHGSQQGGATAVRCGLSSHWQNSASESPITEPSLQSTASIRHQKLLL